MKDLISSTEPLRGALSMASDRLEFDDLTETMGDVRGLR
jgi:hypothetical protein